MISFTRHALERMKQRGISKDEVISIIKETKNPRIDKFGHSIAQKKKGKKLLRVFFLKQGTDIIVITAYMTSKISKYK